MVLLLGLGLLVQDAGSPPPMIPLPTGIWRAWLDSPGGELPFQLELQGDGDHYRVWIVHSEQRAAASSVRRTTGAVEFEWTDLDSVLRAKVLAGGMALDGTWEKQRDRTHKTALGFHARFGPESAPVPPMPIVAPAEPAVTQADSSCSGRWAVQFSGSKHPAVGLLDEQPDGRVHGTILTVLGDYRFLSGWRRGADLTLSTFDGAHAFLLRARAQGGAWNGRFWSGDGAPETWTATRSAQAALPNPYELTRARSERVGNLTFPDLEGAPRSLTDPELRGEACALLIFGSWCPNCHDATATLTDLLHRYGERGLRVIGLAFELTADAERSRRVLAAYQHRHGVRWPILLAGPADKKQASQALPFLDAVIAYPTVVFLDRTGRIDGVYTGFVGPAAGPEHKELVNEWRERVERLLR